MDNRIVLLFGMPRSGTTWLGKIFDSHPLTLYRHEPDSVHRIPSPQLLPEAIREDEVEAVRQYCSGIVANRNVKVVGKSPVFGKHYLSRYNLLCYKLGIGVSRLAANAGISLPVAGTPIHGKDDTRVVWKSIESLGRLGVILEALPEARALQIVRHPCGYIASVERGEKRNRFDGLVPTSEDYGLLEMLLQTSAGRSWGYSMADIRDMYPEERLAWRWAVFNDKALSDTQGNGRALAFAYERLCENPVAVAKSLLTHTGLDWVRQVEQFVSASVGQSDTSYYSVYKNPMQSAWSWETSLDKTTIQRILALASRSKTWRALEYDRLNNSR